MSDLRPRGIPVAIDGVERHFLFTLNLIDELQDRYGKTLHAIIEDIANDVVSGHLLRDVVTIMLNDEAGRLKRKGAQDPPPLITEQEAGELIGLDNYYEILSALLRAYGISLPEPEADDPNGKGGQTSS